MSLQDPDSGRKRSASSPLSEGEEVDDPSSRKSRMKRINLAEIIAEQNLAPPDEKAELETSDVLNNVEVTHSN